MSETPDVEHTEPSDEMQRIISAIAGMNTSTVSNANAVITANDKGVTVRVKGGIVYQFGYSSGVSQQLLDAILKKIEGG